MLKLNSLLKKYDKENIAIFTRKSLNAYSAIFSTVLSGNVWVPISPEQPAARIIKMFDIAKPKAVLIEEELPEDVRKYLEGGKITIIQITDLVESNPEANFESFEFSKEDIAYIMFTSGTTGVPKGVPVTHENYINFVQNVLEVLPFGENEVFSDYHDFAFDISIFYLFACILTKSAFAPIKKEQDKVLPINHIIKNKVTVWSSVPSAINMIKTFRPKDKIPTQIKIMFLCGEPLKPELLEYCFNNMELKNVYNFYGLTESGVENFFHKCRRDYMGKYRKVGSVSIGEPLSGNKVMITGEKELLISGCQITPGYLKGISPDKFIDIDREKWLRTGDIVEVHDNLYYCKGRMDSQIKIAGYRVELMDIEAHLDSKKEIVESVCFLNDSGRGKQLVAAIKAKSEIKTKELLLELSNELPAYMVPKDIFIVKSMPLNSNGKVDRKKLMTIVQCTH
jgi:acyl-coenzyme A synthetase/AMP-(fatty) acid ligase